MAGIISFGSGSANKSRPAVAVDSASTVTLDALPVRHVETDQERPGRSAKHLIKANHVNYAVVYKDLQQSNTNAHAICTAYILGANENQLNAIYDEQIKDLEPWRPSPAEVIDEDWRDFLGDRNYQRAFVDFFEDKLAMKFSYNWKEEMISVLTAGDEPLVNCLIGGFGHPLNHLALAYEVDSKELAMEGLSVTCIQYNGLHKYLDDPSYTKASSLPCSTLKDLILRLASDERLKAQTGSENDSLETLLEQNEAVIVDYWNAWQITDANKQFQESQEAAVALFASCGKSYNFFVAQLLSASNAIRVLLPYIPAQHHISLLRQWWLLAIVVCLIAGRPEPSASNIVSDANDRAWKYVQDKTLNGPHLADADYIKAVRAMKEAANTWGDTDQKYLRSALTFVDNFNGWSF